ncbi:MAG: glycosyltransferase family 2 protein [Gammaproteobacteria bacterium]|nr:glycosyltransferase family 2 protein [Gammaproteobacteria bacterium]
MPATPQPDIDVTVVVPVYDEEESLAELADQIRAACAAASLRFEVWLVDDGSQDGSWTVIEELHRQDPRFAGIRFRMNYGKSAALAAGFEHARGRYVVTMDADLQDDPNEIPALLAVLEEGHDLVSGWKRKRQDRLSKTLPSRFFNSITRWISGIRLHDFNCGLKAYRLEVVKELHIYGEMHRYIPLLAKRQGYTRIAEKVVNHRARRHGHTKFGMERYLNGFLDLLTVAFLTRFATHPMRVFGLFGTLTFLVGVGISLWLSVERLVYGQLVKDRPLLLLGVLLIVVGLQMVFTGFVADMISRRHMEERPAYRIREALQPSARRSTTKRKTEAESA